MLPKEADRQPSPAPSASGRERVATSLVLGGLLLANVVAFALFDRSYLGWYLDHGAEIGLAFAFVAVVVDLDRYPALISDAPWEYVRGARDVAGLTILTIGAAFERPPAGTRPDSGPWTLLGRNLVRLVEILAGGLIAVAIVVAVAVWLVVVAPIQYLVNIVCGQPARSAAESRRAVDVRHRPDGLEVTDSYIDQDPGGTDVERMSLSLRPVAFTNTVAAGVLWFVDRLT